MATTSDITSLNTAINTDRITLDSTRTLAPDNATTAALQDARGASQYQATVFKWTGTYYNATYDTSHTATFSDDDDWYQGSGDDDETVSIDGAPPQTTTGAAYDIRINFTATDGTAQEENFVFFQTGGEWYFVPGPGSAFTEGATLGSYQSHSVGWKYAQLACFAKGTLIETNRGAVPVQALLAGDRLVTGDGQLATLRLALSRQISTTALRREPRLRPVTISAGALGLGLPRRDLQVSRQHRMLVSSPIARRMFTQPETLVAAIHLTRLPGIYVAPPPAPGDRIGVEYFHLLLDQHQILIAEGAPSESLLVGRQSMAGLHDAARHEILTLFPQLNDSRNWPKPARPMPEGPRLKRLIDRHLRNAKPILSTYNMPTGQPQHAQPPT